MSLDLFVVFLLSWVLANPSVLEVLFMHSLVLFQEHKQLLFKVGVLSQPRKLMVDISVD